MHPWQRQPGEPAADFSAFVTYLRLKGRRSLRRAATQAGRPIAAIRRLSARFNWLARVTAFEARLADASQNALDLWVHAASTPTRADYERLRRAEFQLAQRVLQESCRWLELASNPRRRAMSLGQICLVIELATKLGRLAAGMPTGDEPRRRAVKDDAPGYWTAPSVEEALEKIYGSPSASGSPPSPAAAPVSFHEPSSHPACGRPLPRSKRGGGKGEGALSGSGIHSANLDSEKSFPFSADASAGVGGPLPAAADSQNTAASQNIAQPANHHLNPGPCQLQPATCKPPSIAGQTPLPAPEHRRRDMWSAWARSQCRATSSSQR